MQQEADNRTYQSAKYRSVHNITSGISAVRSLEDDVFRACVMHMWTSLSGAAGCCIDGVGVWGV